MSMTEVAANSEAPVAVAMREAAEQLDKLTALVGELEDRLQPVRRRGSDDPRADEMAKPSPGGHSLLASNLTGQVDTIRQLQRHIRTLLDELEV